VSNYLEFLSAKTHQGCEHGFEPLWLPKVLAFVFFFCVTWSTEGYKVAQCVGFYVGTIGEAAEWYSMVNIKGTPEFGFLSTTLLAGMSIAPASLPGLSNPIRSIIVLFATSPARIVGSPPILRFPFTEACSGTELSSTIPSVPTGTHKMISAHFTHDFDAFILGGCTTSECGCHTHPRAVFTKGGWWLIERLRTYWTCFVDAFLGRSTNPVFYSFHKKIIAQLHDHVNTLALGSECYGAVINGRKAIGIELKESYYRQMVKNVAEGAKTGRGSEQVLLPGVIPTEPMMEAPE